MSRSNRSLDYYEQFDALVHRRKASGMTHERMASLLHDMSLKGDTYVPVSAEDLRAVEEDELHGLSIAALMYVRFMEATVGINGVGKPSDQLVILNKPTRSDIIRGSEKHLLHARRNLDEVVRVRVDTKRSLPRHNKKCWIVADFGRDDPSDDKDKRALLTIMRRLIRKARERELRRLDAIEARAKEMARK